MKWSLEYWAVGSQSACGVKPSQRCALSLHRKDMAHKTWPMAIFHLAIHLRIAQMFPVLKLLEAQSIYWARGLKIQNWKVVTVSLVSWTLLIGQSLNQPLAQSHLKDAPGPSIVFWHRNWSFRSTMDCSLVLSRVFGHLPKFTDSLFSCWLCFRDNLVLLQWSLVGHLHPNNVMHLWAR